jgi:aminopeptidase N
MSFFETVFGPYPFASEKYGMTQLGFYGGIENQTNSIVNRMSADYFMVSVHELAHMWFGDMITCSDWHEVWLNEGFATYAECLWLESQGGPGAYRECLEKRKYLGGGTLVLESDQDPFGIFRTIAYYKGAWVLHMLRGIMGDQPFFTALRAYAGDDRLQYANATSIDFREHCERITGMDLSQFFEQWLYQPYFPVYHYHFEQTPDQQMTLFIGQNQTEEYPEAPYFKMPLDVLIRYADGTDTLIRVLNEALPLENYTFELEKKIDQVILDPEDEVLCQKKVEQATFVPGFSKDPAEPGVFPNPFFPGQQLRITPINEEAIYTLTNPDGRFDRLYADERGNLRLPPGKKWTPGIHFLMIRSRNKPPFQLPLVCLPRD